MLDPVGENDCVFTEAYTKDEVLNSEILREGHDVSFKNYREYLLHSSIEGQFDCMQKGLLPEQLSQDKQNPKIFEDRHVFYDPIVEYMGILSSQDNELCVWNNEMNHLEESKVPEDDISSYFLNS